jgi:hypothetical protein
LLIVIAVLIFALAFRKITRDVARGKREIRYTIAFNAYSQALHPGMTRKDTEEYLHSRNTQFSWVFTAFGGRRESQYADIVKIGEEAAPWYCSYAYVYVAFEFAPVKDFRQTDSDVLQKIEMFRPYTGCLDTRDGRGKGRETSLPRVESLVPQRDSNGTKAGIVDREDLNGGAANGCLSHQVRTVPFKMVAPPVSPGMKEFDDFAGLRIPPGNVWALVLVAVQACKSKILQAGFSAVLPGDDVVGVKGTQIPGRRHMPILAAPFGPFPRPADQSLIHELRVSRKGSTPDFLKAARAGECITDKTFAMLTYPSNSAFSSGIKAPSLDLSIRSRMRV